MTFDYRLAVLTHGRMGTLDAALESFFAHVTPRPSQVCVYADGVLPSMRRSWQERERRNGVELRAGPVQQGFCAATGQLWRWATEGDVPYVFWLEHDFMIERPVDLRELAAVLDADRSIAQMALVRGPVSPVEEEAGGLIESRPGEFDLRAIMVADGVRVPWLRHRSFFTTNPSLMRTDFMRENPWPVDGQAQCEGHYGIDLVQRGYEFGYWGAGEQWVDHIGVRTGIGY